MFDVYLNEKRDRLLVVAKEQPIPNIGNSGRWRKKKGAVAVSRRDQVGLAERWLLLAQTGRTSREQFVAK
jgi:hypothetical protein